jgi:Xaa-Pro dipeptidase
MADSLRRLQELMQDAELDLLTLLPGPNLYYLTSLHFHLMERPTVLFVPVSGEAAIVLPELEAARAAEALPNLTRFPYGEEESERAQAFQAAASHFSGVSRVGVEPLRMRFFEQELLLEAAPGWSLVSAEEALLQLRIHKSGDEIDRMQVAVQIAEKALHDTLPLIQTGMSERELAAELVIQLLRAGSEPDLPFDPIVASGPNSALPHATPTDRKLTSGDLLIIDWGARHGGYISDLTRTFSIGPATDRMRQIHALVEGANRAGREATVPGVRAGQVDRAAREVIEAGGFGEYFIHRTGHGIGLEAHEPPGIRAGEGLQLELGMTFTIEPGIYLPGEGGVRIEDNVAVTEDGLQVLSSLTRDLIELP